MTILLLAAWFAQTVLGTVGRLMKKRFVSLRSTRRCIMSGQLLSRQCKMFTSSCSILRLAKSERRGPQNESVTPRGPACT